MPPCAFDNPADILAIMPGPPLRTDIIEVYVFRELRGFWGFQGSRSNPADQGVEFLQLHRTQGAMTGTWQPVMGHVESGETAPTAALRELNEETGYRPGHGLLGFWQLELVNTFYLATHDQIMLCPGFPAQVAGGASGGDSGGEPQLDAAHDAFRWVPADQVDALFLWPGQRAAIAHIQRDILPPDSPIAALLRLPLPPP
jgi:8-oxo-dGTP pyrophosphatase MutT (NUDIX family)